MAADVIRTLRDAALGSSRDDEACPAFVIDTTAAALLIVNAPGRTLLGLESHAPLPYPLDSAMPALVRLRQIPHNVTGRATVERLTFWGNGRLRPAECEVTLLANGPSGTAFSIRCTTDGTSLPAAAATEASTDHVAVIDDQFESPPRVARDDTETLKEIARRIGEGQMSAPLPQRPSAAMRETTPEVDNSPQAAEPSQPLADIVASQSHQSPVHPVPIRLQPRPMPRDLDASDLAKLAHELKTPLTAIAAASEIMRDERLGRMGNAKYLGYAADIHDSAKHALSVISTMLTSEADADESTAASGIDLNELVASTVSSMQPLAAERGLTLAFDPEEGAPVITANATALRQILLNLLNNALKFTPEEGDVRAVTGYLADGSVFLVVRDTGDGIDPAALEFANDDRGGHSGPHPGGGHGIGLPLVRQLASGMGAEVEIDSAPGKGTVVLIAFPKTSRQHF